MTDPSCSKCGGHGYIRDDVSSARPCDCRYEWKFILQRAGVPAEHRAVPEDLPIPDADIENWSGDPWCMVFLPRIEKDGSVPRPNGTGKTWLAVRVLGLWIREGRGRTVRPPKTGRHTVLGAGGRIVGTKGSPRFAHVGWALENMRRDIGSGFDATMDALCSARLLVLDDWAAMRQTEYGQEMMRLLIEHRSTNALPTIVTCDRPLEAVDSDDNAVVEVRLASRMGKRSSDGRSYAFEIDHETDRRTG